MVDFLSMIRLEDLTDDQYELAEIVGMDLYRQLVRTFGGSSIRIMKEDTLTKELRNATIRAEYDGSNIRQLSLKYNLSDKSIYNALNSCKKG